MSRIFIILMIFFCMYIDAMDITTKKLGNVVFAHKDIRGLIFNCVGVDSKINLFLTSKIFADNYNNFIKNLTFNEYIDGLYLFDDYSKQFRDWVTQENSYQKLQWFRDLKKDQQSVLVNKLKSYRNSLINYDVFPYKPSDGFWFTSKKNYINGKLQSNDCIVNCIIKVIATRNSREMFKFCIPYYDVRIAIALFWEKYIEPYYEYILKDICLFFNQESSINSFTAIENSITENKVDIINKINEALEKKNFSVLVFLLYWFFRKFPADDIKSLFDVATDDNKRVLMQAGCKAEPLIELLKEAAYNKNVERVKFFTNLILESGNLDHRVLKGDSSLDEYIFQFDLYDLIPKLFEKSIYLTNDLNRKTVKDAHRIRIIIEKCYNYYGKNLWKDEKSRCFLNFALGSVAYDQKLFDYLSSVMDTLPCVNDGCELFELVKKDRDNQSFGKKMEFLLSKNLDAIDCLEYRFIRKNHWDSDVYRIVLWTSEDIIIEMLKAKQSMNENFGGDYDYFFQNFFVCAVKVKKWSIVKYLLPRINIKCITKLSSNYIDQVKECSPISYTTFIQDVCFDFFKQLMEHCPQEMLVAIKIYMNKNKIWHFYNKDDDFVANMLLTATEMKQNDIVNLLLLQDKISFSEWKELLHRVGISKTVDVIFHRWWDSLSDLKKMFISSGFVVTLVSCIVGLCYKFTYIHSIV